MNLIVLNECRVISKGLYNKLYEIPDAKLIGQPNYLVYLIIN